MEQIINQITHQKDLLSQDQDNKIYRELINLVPKNALANKNKAKSWQYGYNEKYNFVVISKTGEIDQILNVQGLNIALPKVSKEVFQRSDKKEKQHWEPQVIPKQLQKIKSIFQLIYFYNLDFSLFVEKYCNNKLFI